MLTFFLANGAEAASLYLTSSSNKVTVGGLVTINLLLNTQGKTINNAEASLQFSNDLVEVISVKGSLFSLWVESPSFSNSSGLISFNGGIPDPGYNGGGTKVLTIIAKAKKAGAASFLFNDAAVRENDGLGTDVLTGQSPVSFAIISNVVEQETKTETKLENNSNSINTNNPTSANRGNSVPVDTSLTPIAVTSPSYPESSSWYSVKDGKISWSVPTNASSIETLLDNSAHSIPTIKYSPPIKSKSLSGLMDGVWYFHLRYLLNNEWSQVSHYKIQIDTTSPTGFSILPEKNNNGCIVGLRLAANDSTSGVDYYNISVDNQPIIKVTAKDAENTIPSPQSDSSTHHIVAAVYDKAGNKSELKLDLNSEGCGALNVALATGTGAIVNSAKGTLPLYTPPSVNGYFNFSNLLKLLALLVLLYGWYKYAFIKMRLSRANKRASHLSISLLLDKADSELLILERAKKKKNLTRSEEKALDSLIKIIKDIDSINGPGK